MARTFRRLPDQGLFRTPVLIEDTISYSEYFEVSQLDNRIFHAGKNGFLIRGTQFLKPNSEISIEILDRLNNPVFVSPVADYEEGGSRLVSVEIYQKTADGSANLIILGTADTYANGRPIPREWQNRPNVRWIVPVQIETANPNISPLRLANEPIAVITEKDYLTTRIDKTTIISSLYTASLDYDYDANKSDGYAFTMLNNAGQPVTFFDTVNVDGIFTGSLFRKTIESSSAGAITTVSTGDIQGYVTASVSMSLDKVLNETTAITQTPIKFGDDTDYLNPLLMSGSFQRVIRIADFGGGATKHTIEQYTSSVVFEYVSESLVNLTSTSSVMSFRIPFAQTITGEVAKVKISTKESNAAITSFVPFAEFVPGERNLITSSSLSGTQIGSFHQAGVFTERHILDSNWFSALFNKADGDFNQTDYESDGTSLTYGKTSITSSEKILEGAEVDHTASAVPYFFGTKTGIQFYKNVEYTLKYTAVYTPSFVTSSGGVAQGASPYTTSNTGSLKTFLTRTANHIDSGSFLVNDAEPVQIGSLSKYGMWVDGIKTRDNDKSLYEREVNFKIPGNGLTYLRFKSEDGFWSLGNIEITPAVEKGFNPDEIIFDAENNILPATTNDFKVQFLNFEDTHHLIGTGVFVSASNLPKDGTDGSTGPGTNFVFVRQTAKPATPNNSSISVNGGVPTSPITWHDSPPATPLQTLWASKGTLAAGGTEYEWGAVFQIEAEGVAERFIYRLNSNTIVNTTGTMNFVTGVLTPPTDWSSAVPSLASDGDIVYVSVGLFVGSPTATAQAILGTWSAPTIYARRTDGTDAKSVDITSAYYFISYAADGGTPAPSSAFNLTATAQSFTDPYFKFTGDGISDEGSFTDGSGASDTFSFPIPTTYFSTPKTLRVGVAEAAASSTEIAFDTLSIVAIKQGSGDDGGVGPGLVFRGAYDSGTKYYQTGLRKDIVKHAGSYWIVDEPGDTGTTYWDTPGSDDWVAFGAQFDSVATDILLAQQATITQGLVMGSLDYFTDATCDYNNDPTITHDANSSIVPGLRVTGTGIPAGSYVASINSTTSFELNASTTGGSVTNGTLTFTPYAFLRSADAINLTTGTGFFMDTSGSFRVGDPSAGHLKWDAGTSIATVGGWTLGSTLSAGSGGTYILLDPGNSKVRIGAKTSLTDGNTGVHLGSDGLALGASSVFEVTAAGAVTAANLTITGGSINVNSGVFTVSTAGAVAASNLTITGGSLSVGSSNSIFRVDTDGDLWIGHATQGSAPFQVSKIGALIATSATITGAITATTGKIGAYTLSATDLYGPHETLNNAGVLMVIGDMTGTPKIALGASADAITHKLAGTGFYADGAGNFRVGTPDNYIAFDSGSGITLQGTLSGTNTAAFDGIDIPTEEVFGVVLTGMKAWAPEATSHVRGIQQYNIATITTTAADNEYAKFTDTGLEGRSYAEVWDDIDAAAELAGIYDWTTVDVGGGSAYIDGSNINPAYRPTAGTMAVVASSDSDASHIAMFDSATGTAQAVKTDPGLTYNVGSNALTATTFVGALTGNVTGNVSGTAPAGSLTGGTLNSGVTASSLTSLGTISSLVATTADINAGTFDGIVGGTTPAAGAFTTLNASGASVFIGNVTIGNEGGDALTFYPNAWTLSNAVTITGTWANLGTVTTVDINGGTIDGATVGASARTTGAFSSLGVGQAYGAAALAITEAADGQQAVIVIHTDSDNPSGIEVDFNALTSTTARSKWFFRGKKQGGAVMSGLWADGGATFAGNIDGAGKWRAAPVEALYGGTGLAGCTAGSIIYANEANNWLQLTASGHDGKFLKLVNGFPAWATPAGDITSVMTTANRGLSGGNTTGDIDLELDIAGLNQAAVTVASEIAFETDTTAGPKNARLDAIPLNVFKPDATTSAELAGLITNETGTGLLVFGTSPTLVTPIIAATHWETATHTHAGGTTGGTIEISATTGTLATTRGGTGLDSYAEFDLIYAQEANTLVALTKSGTEGWVLTAGDDGEPEWAAPPASGVTSITPGTGIAGSSAITGTGTIALDFDELTDMTADISDGTEFIIHNGTVESRKRAIEIQLSHFSNNSNWTANTGTVTSIATGTGISGGTITGTGTISIGQSVGTGDDVTFGTVRVDDAIAATNKTTGALIVENGGVGVALNVWATDVVATSDIRLKNVVGGVSNALSTVNKLNAIRYTWTDERDDKEHVGFSAQDVLKLVPEAVYGSEETEYGISYGKLVPVLVEAIKELTAEVEALKKKIGD